MSICATLKVEPEKADAIQALFEFESGLSATLVEHTASIARHIAYIHGPEGESQAHLRPYVTSEAQWDKTFPTMAKGRGEIVIGWDYGQDEATRALAKLKFVLDHPELFVRATEIRELASFFDSEVGEKFPQLQCKLALSTHPSGLFWTEIIGGKPSLPEPEPSFEQMHKENNELYNLALIHNAAHFWHAFVLFRANPNQESWANLRGYLVPWAMGTGLNNDESDIGSFVLSNTVWQLVNAKYGLDNERSDCFVHGQFEHNFPGFDFVENALLNAPLYRSVYRMACDDGSYQNARQVYGQGGGSTST